MAIVLQTVLNGINARVDAEGSQRFLPDLDQIPAINNALPTLVGYIATAYAERKISEESFRELVYTRVWQTNQYGRVFLDEGSNLVGVPTFIWGVLAVYGEPATIPAVPVITPTAPAVSLYRDDVAFNSSDFPAKRLTIEEIAKARRNSFAAGNEVLATGPNRTYSYCMIGNARSSTSYPVTGWEIEVAPKSLTAHKLVGISFLKTPNIVVAGASSIEFPTSLTDLIVRQACKEMMVKAGDSDRASLYNVSAQEVIERLRASV